MADNPRPPDHFCPWCGEPMDMTRRVWFLPDDGVHGEAILCSETCLRHWTGAGAFSPVDDDDGLVVLNSYDEVEAAREIEVL